MFEKIMFPTDFSEVSTHALENCIPKLFEMGTKEIIVIHVVDILPSQYMIMEELEMEAKKKLDKIIEDLKSKGINATGNVYLGSITPTIVEEARCPYLEIIDRGVCEMVDLIVIPSKGKNLKRLTQIGNTALNVVRKSSIPVLLLKYDWNREKNSLEFYGDCGRMFEKPLIALDLSPCSDLIISVVRRFSEKIKHAKLYHVVDYGDVEKMEENIEKAKNALSLYAKKLDFDCDTEVDVGIASKEILAKIVEYKPSMLVIGKTGRGFLREILLGSTADALIREAKIPILVVPCR